MHEVTTTDELKTITGALDALGIEYTTDRVYQIEVSEPDVRVGDTTDVTDAEEIDNSDDTEREYPTGMPAENTKLYAVAKAVALHDKAWITFEDLMESEDCPYDDPQLISARLSELKRRGVTDKRSALGRTRNVKEHKLKEAYRREFAAHDDLNTGLAELFG